MLAVMVHTHFHTTPLWKLMSLLLTNLYFTGVSPKEGPPGTLITIRGENLGTDLKDLVSVTICEVEMVLTADWVSKRKITVRSGLGVGMYLYCIILYLSITYCFQIKDRCCTWLGDTRPTTSLQHLASRTNVYNTAHSLKKLVTGRQNWPEKLTHQWDLNDQFWWKFEKH